MSVETSSLVLCDDSLTLPPDLPLAEACSLLAVSRPEFLARLLALGVEPLEERQRIANCLGRLRREGRLQDVAPPKLAGALPARMALVTYGDERYAVQRARIVSRSSRRYSLHTGAGCRRTCLGFSRPRACGRRSCRA